MKDLGSHLLSTLVSTVVAWLSVAAAGVVVDGVDAATNSLNRVFSVRMSGLRAGPTWVLVMWEPDLVLMKAEGRLTVILSYRWSTISGTMNTVYAMPTNTGPHGFTPTQYNLTNLLTNTWHAVCLNATHTVSNFVKPSFSCSAIKTLTGNGTVPSQSVLDSSYSIDVGATWMDLHIVEFKTPYTIVHWMVVAKTSPTQPSTHLNPPQVVHYQDHDIRRRDDDDAREHIFHLDGLTAATSYEVTIEARYKVNVGDNQKLHEYRDNVVVDTKLSSASVVRFTGTYWLLLLGVAIRHLL